MGWKDLLKEKILKIVDEKHGAFWGEFINEIPNENPENIQICLRELLKDGVLRQKEDDMEHDWEYVRKINEGKTPRLFYYSEAVSAWVPIDGNDEISTIIDVEQFSCSGEIIELQFKRFDMSDVEFKNIPED